MKNLTQGLSQIADNRDGTAILSILTDVYERLRSVCFSSAGLVIKAGGGVLVKTGAAAVNFVTQGVLQTIAAATDMPALVGTVTNAAFNVYVFSVDSAGTTYTDMGTEGATLGAVRFPNVPATRTVLGYITINPTGTGDFVGGTTALDDATVVPTAVYINTQGAFDVNATVV